MRPGPGRQGKGMSYGYDVAVIGSGIAGLVSAVTANGLGRRTVLVEKGRFGGNCTNFTCIPSKTLIRIGHTAREAARLRALGVQQDASAEIDGAALFERIRSVVRTGYEKDLPETFEAIGVTVVSGAARFIDAHHIDVRGRTISAEKFIIATGTRPLVPRLPGLSDVNYLTSENLYALESLPKSLAILGGGVDGLEYASAFGRLGVETTVVEMAPQILATADRELVNRLLEVMREDGIRIFDGAKVTGLRKVDGGAALDYERGEGGSGEIRAEAVLVALGRAVDLEGLDLERAGVEYNRRGIVTDKTLRTTAANIYACGDTVGPYQLATTAEYQGVIAASNASLPVKRSVDYSNNVFVIFTEPPLAYIGLTEAEAHAKYEHKLSVYRFDYAHMRRALIDGAEDGVGKFLCDGRGRLVGAHILGEAAPEVIHEAQVVKALKIPLRKLQSVTHGYPTYAQALVGRASQLAFLDRMAGSFFVDLGLGLLPGCSNRLKLTRDRLAEADDTVPPEPPFAPGFRVERGGIDGEGVTITLPEDLTHYDECPLLAALAANGAPGTDIAVDFGAVRRMNGLGACMLVKLYAKFAKSGIRLHAYNVGDTLRDTLAVTGLDRAMRVVDGESQVAGVSGAPGDTLAVNGDVWAKPVQRLTVPPMPKEARNLNVDGRRTLGPVNGFGQLWQKVYRLPLAGASVTPEETVKILKERFIEFQPSFNRFYASSAGIQPGEVVLIDSMTPGGPVATGVMTLYAGERSFTFVTPEGHPEAGFITFGAYETEGVVVARIVGLTRAGDPLYELGFHLAGSKVQVRIWRHFLTSLAVHLGVPAEIAVEQRCVDRRLRWSEAGNVIQNAQIRTLLAEPFRLLGLR